jgi:hypothetical protein
MKIDGKFNDGVYEKYLTEYLLPYTEKYELGDNWRLLQDNHPSHVSKRIKTFFNQKYGVGGYEKMVMDHPARLFLKISL